MTGINVNEEMLAPYMTKVREVGMKMGDQYSDKITEMALGLYKQAADSQGIDLEMEAEEQGVDVDNMIWNTDSFMDMVIGLSESMIEGIGEMWPYPLGMAEG